MAHAGCRTRLLCMLAELACATLVARGIVAPGTAAMAAERGAFNVRDHGAAGDGKTLDTAAIHKAIAACVAAGGGEVVFPAGSYLSGTVHLRSNVTLRLEAGARLVGSKELAHYQHFTPPEGSFEARSPKWHRALVLGEGVQNVAILGPGTIDGAKVFDPQGEEKMRGPHTIVIGRSKAVTIRDVTVTDSANYAIMVEWSDEVEVRGVKVTGGWDGVHFRASADRPCRDLRIVGCRFSTGDDSIAGRYVKNLLVEDCTINSSCNGMRIIGPVTNMAVRNCRFYGPGVHPHRTSDRRNMLSGILLQPGAWDRCDGPLEDVSISDVTMKNVASPVTIWLKRPTNTADRIMIVRLTATGVYRAAASVESWTDVLVGRVEFRDVSLEFAGGGTLPRAKAPLKPPGLDSRPLPAWGFYARNVRDLRLENVRLGCAKADLRHVMICDGADRLTLESLSYPKVRGAAEPLVLDHVKELHARDAGVSSPPPPRPRDKR